MGKLGKNTLLVRFFFGQNGTATSRRDYFGLSDTLTFNPGQTSKTIKVNVLGDTTFEPSEIFRISLSNASQGSIEDATGVGTILNNAVGGNMEISSAVGIINNDHLTFTGTYGANILLAGNENNIVIGL